MGPGYAPGYGLHYVEEHAVGTSVMINTTAGLLGLRYSVSISGPILVYTGVSLQVQYSRGLKNVEGPIRERRPGSG